MCQEGQRIHLRFSMCWEVGANCFPHFKNFKLQFNLKMFDDEADSFFSSDF